MATRSHKSSSTCKRSVSSQYSSISKSTPLEKDEEWEDVTASVPFPKNSTSGLHQDPIKVKLTSKITPNEHGSVIVGSTFDYIIKISNIDVDTLIHPQLAVTIPPFQELISVNTAQAPNWNTTSSSTNGVTIISTIPSLAPKNNATFVFRLKQNMVENSITDYSLHTDLIADNTTSISIMDPVNIVYRAELHLEKSSRLDRQHIFYTLEVTNRGPSIANNVSITDVLPDGVEFIAVSAPEAIVNVVKGIVIAVWPGDTLAKQSHVMNIEVAVPELSPNEEGTRRRFINRAVATSLTGS